MPSLVAGHRRRRGSPAKPALFTLGVMSSVRNFGSTLRWTCAVSPGVVCEWPIRQGAMLLGVPAGAEPAGASRPSSRGQSDRDQRQGQQPRRTVPR
ncbi:hypothetical protein BT67DRAFT_247362 [Trichocladium antarcticum]|uniref:Uncharacterized protein n=1 Tax=Trichocladium antarcticum TaxID=1450529 RepID=A0AAN6Z8V1_9PEZI|nr:hypothetical protein BT67DRAFT_247362 [Trichocladium antarcticum]